MRSLALFAIILIAISYACWHLLFLAYALRSVLLALVLLGLVVVVLRGDR